MLSGHIVVSNYGAGTANTEFDIMTGMQTNMICKGSTSSFRVIRKKTESLASVLSDNGYKTYFMHPGDAWFYNRTSVYEYLGISDQVFKEAFSDNEYKGGFVSDDAFLNQLKINLKDRLSDDTPLFGYTVTIQNHQAYPYTKYDYQVPEVKCSKEISDASKEQLSVYFEGIKDSCKMLSDMVEYFDTLKEPCLLVFFGDHRPSLGNACEELGLEYNTNSSLNSTLASYSVPFMIYANKSYQSKTDINSVYASLDLGDNIYISSSYLGAMAMEISGNCGESSYFDYLNQARRTLPVIIFKEHVYMDSNGILKNELNGEESTVVDTLHKWLYYKLK